MVGFKTKAFPNYNLINQIWGRNENDDGVGKGVVEVAGKALGIDALRNLEIVSNNSVIDLAANQMTGYGLVTDIINGGLKCGRADDA
ncbi:Glycoside hydrolase, family 19, catalytic [Corchorus olitorius]|uniref:Glycoside hydrolase, family 19, catalytic n=1 Tax=Corchorus olitorius TaxID=93759 RepID=A0A1R3HHI8_9ROSI|nr:Glycoside hydrolase, family 19, catalytic [Corchorus olitorius]